MCFKSFESMANLTVVRDFELEKRIEEWRRLDKVGSLRIGRRTTATRPL